MNLGDWKHTVLDAVLESKVVIDWRESRRRMSRFVVWQTGKSGVPGIWRLGVIGVDSLPLSHKMGSKQYHPFRCSCTVNLQKPNALYAV